MNQIYLLFVFSLITMLMGFTKVSSQKTMDQYKDLSNKKTYIHYIRAD